MKKINLLNMFLYAIFITIIISCTQNEGPVIREDLKEENIVSDNTGNIITISKDTLRIPIVHHISRRNDGTNATVTEARINKIMGDINSNYKSAKIQFFTKEIEFINNSTWNNSFSKQDDFNDRRVLKPFEDDDALNLFYFNTLLSGGNSIGATALFPNQGNNVKLSSSSTEISNTATITHEIGHYLGLYHTDDDFTDDQGRIELVDGSNCTVAGDKICDTPASPRLTNNNVSNTTCEYIGNETDPVGQPYQPDTFNFMTSSGRTRSDESGLCRRRFTDGQIAKMLSILDNERSYLITRE